MGLPDYPLKFIPILKEKIWGGQKLINLLHKDSNLKDLGESWEISGVQNDVSIAQNGRFQGKSLAYLMETFKGDFLGNSIYEKFGPEFPLLIKFIDAKTELSVQLHPNDKLAKERHNSFGKTEMWYIMQADEGAEINVGFNKSTNREEYLSYLESGNITNLLHFEKVKKGDSVFINTGKVHAIGAGVLLAEIQQTSDITYRIYDWDRKDSNGNYRELHTAQALEAIDFEMKADYKLDYSRKENTSSIIAHCDYFTTNYLPVKGEVVKNYNNLDSFVIYMCVSGAAEVKSNGNVELIEQGQTVLIPANIHNVSISSEGVELLEVYID